MPWWDTVPCGIPYRGGYCAVRDSFHGVQLHMPLCGAALMRAAPGVYATGCVSTAQEYLCAPCGASVDAMCCGESSRCADKCSVDAAWRLYVSCCLRHRSCSSCSSCTRVWTTSLRASASTAVSADARLPAAASRLRYDADAAWEGSGRARVNLRARVRLCASLRTCVCAVVSLIGVRTYPCASLPCTCTWLACLCSYAYICNCISLPL